MPSGSEKAPYRKKQLILNAGVSEVQADFPVSAHQDTACVGRRPLPHTHTLYNPKISPG